MSFGPESSELTKLDALEDLRVEFRASLIKVISQL